MPTRPDPLRTASISTLLLGYALALGLLRAAASWPLFGGRPDPVATSPPPPQPPRGLLRAWLAVTAVLTAAWVAFLVYVVAKLIETVL